MTQDELDRKLDRIAKKRDYAADVMNNPILAWSYQQEIDKLLAEHTRPESRR